MENPHRVANVPNVRRHANARRNVPSNASYGFVCTKDAEYKCGVSYSSRLQQEKNYLQRSVSADNVVIRSRGYKPSDRHDPVKRNFLENLTSKILHFDMVSRRDIEQLLTSRRHYLWEFLNETEKHCYRIQGSLKFHI